MQYENVFKVIGVVHVILAFLKSSPAAQTDLKMAAAPCTGTGSPPVAQYLLTIATPKQVHIYTYMQMRAKTKKQYNNT